MKTGVNASPVKTGVNASPVKVAVKAVPVKVDVVAPPLKVAVSVDVTIVSLPALPIVQSFVPVLMNL